MGTSPAEVAAPPPESLASASQKLPVIDAEALAQVLAPLRKLQQNLDAGGLDGAVSNAEQLCHAYVDTSCSDAIDFELWKAKYVAHELREQVLARGDALLASVRGVSMPDDGYVPTQQGSQEPDAAAVKALVEAAKGKGKSKEIARAEPYLSA